MARGVGGGPKRVRGFLNPGKGRGRRFVDLGALGVKARALCERMNAAEAAAADQPSGLKRALLNLEASSDDVLREVAGLLRERGAGADRQRALAHFNAFVAKIGVSPRLVLTTRGLRVDFAIRGPAASLAFSDCVDVLFSDGLPPNFPQRMKPCASCGEWFLDEVKAGNSKHCSETCRQREKKRRLRRQQRRRL